MSSCKEKYDTAQMDPNISGLASSDFLTNLQSTYERSRKQLDQMNQ